MLLRIGRARRDLDQWRLCSCPCLRLKDCTAALDPGRANLEATMDLRERLARDLLNSDYASLNDQKKSVIDLIADQRPTAVDPLMLDDRNFWERLADRVAAVGGSWRFIFGFGAILAMWVVSNIALALSDRAFDPYPFIFLNLILSMLAAVQAPIIMMSQNRQAAKDRSDARSDYEVNLRAEMQIIALHEKIDATRDPERDLTLKLLQEHGRLLREIDARLARQEAGQDARPDTRRGAGPVGDDRM
jgi:uncharacterized membrane protein